jgi:hypothetical protein
MNHVIWCLTFDVGFLYFSVQCPAEKLKTDRGNFLWEPVAHGVVSRLPCPYGMSTNYMEQLEQMARDSPVGLGYHPFHNPAPPPKPDVKIHNLEKGNSHHGFISDVELRVSYGNGELICPF